MKGDRSSVAETYTSDSKVVDVGSCLAVSLVFSSAFRSRSLSSLGLDFESGF